MILSDVPVKTIQIGETRLVYAQTDNRVMVYEVHGRSRDLPGFLDLAESEGVTEVLFLCFRKTALGIYQEAFTKSPRWGDIQIKGFFLGVSLEGSNGGA